MRKLMKFAGQVVVCGLLGQPGLGLAQAPTPVPPSITTPDRMLTRLGPLEFRDGAPSPATTQLLYDNLDLMHGVQAFTNAFRGVSTHALRLGFIAAGAEDNTIVVFSRLMDSRSLFLTGNADTVYFLGFIDMTKGPVVFETPPRSLGTLDDMWFEWVTDFGNPGPDRGEGGRYLLLPHDYNGPVPEGGFFVRRVNTTRALILGRAFLENNDPAPAARSIREHTRIYPYTPGAYGTSIAEILTGSVRAGRNEPPPPTRFMEGSGVPFQTIPANDFSYFEQLNSLVQQEPPAGLGPEIMGSLAAIGIVKGRPFAPDARMRAILTEAAAIGNGISRTLSWAPRQSEGFGYYPNSMWFNGLFVGGFDFATPPPQVTREGIRPFAPVPYRTLNSRTQFFYYATGISPAMIMRLPDIGSQYLEGFTDSTGAYLDGGKAYRVTLPPNIPAAAFWSFTVYDNQTRSMLQTQQLHPRAGSQSFPSPAATPNPDGSTTVHFGPTRPAGVPEGNWIQTTPGRGWNVLLRLYSPLESFFTREWRAGEIELVP